MNVQPISLPTGPYDWAEQILPQALFDKRLATLRDLLRSRGLDGLIVHGNPFDHGTLSWVTAFTPKLGPALAFISIDAPTRLVFTGGPGMKPSAQRLTFLEGVAAMRNIEADTRAWLAELGTTRVALCEGSAMSRDSYLALERALGAAPIFLDDDVDSLRRKKDEIERSLARQAHRCLGLAVRALEGNAPEGRRAAALAAEAAARSGGAQDVRVLIAQRPQGAPLPFDGSDTPVPSPAPYAVAVRFRGYWACAEGVMGGDSALVTEAHRILADACRHRGLLAVSEDWRLSWHGIGLSLREMPSEREALRPGDLVSLRVARVHDRDAHLVWSQIVQVEGSGMHPLSLDLDGR
jgi:hypothetical protein